VHEVPDRQISSETRPPAVCPLCYGPICPACRIEPLFRPTQIPNPRPDASSAVARPDASSDSTADTANPCTNSTAHSRLGEPKVQITTVADTFDHPRADTTPYATHRLSNIYADRAHRLPNAGSVTSPDTAPNGITRAAHSISNPCTDTVLLPD
jgi:hypothetical protein